MYKLIFISALFVGCYAYPTVKVVNGTDAEWGEIPYIVSLRNNGKHSCGGSILDATHILTASHCVNGRSPSLLSIQYGILKIGGSDNVIQVKTISQHPEYVSGGSYQNDVAVLTLEEPIQFSETVKPTTLPEPFDPTPGNSPAVLAGWGRTSSSDPVTDDLKRVNILIYSDEECEERHDGRTQRQWHVCGGVPEGGKGQCNGDSGGPLFVNGEQRGIVSWSIKPCTVAGFPGVFANVANYVNWIREQM